MDPPHIGNKQRVGVHSSSDEKTGLGEYIIADVLTECIGLFSPIEDRLGDDELTCRTGVVSRHSSTGRMSQNANKSSKARPRVIRRQDIRKRVYLKIRTLGKHADAAWVKNRRYFFAVFKKPNGLYPVGEEVTSDLLIFLVVPRNRISAESNTCQ
jgi:hypothetical protein